MARSPLSASALARLFSRRSLSLLLLAGATGLGLLLFGGGAGAAAGPGAAVGVAAPLPAPTIRSVAVAATEQQFTADDGRLITTDRLLTIEGSGFFGTSFGPYVHFRLADGSVLEAPLVILESGERLIASPPRGTWGPVTLVVENPDHGTAAFSVGL